MDLETQKTLTRFHDLQRQRRELLALAPETAMERILDARHPAAVVHAFAEEDLYFLVREIGPEDALPLLSLASDRQWEFMLDIETWQRDRLDLPAVTRWLDLMFQADPGRFVSRFAGEKKDILEYYVHKTVEIRIREYEEDPRDLGTGFVTPDDVYYYRILPVVRGGLPEADNMDGTITRERRESFLAVFLKKYAEHDLAALRDLLIASTGTIAGEAEEEIFRLRNVRLAEKGYQPFHEAIGVYQPLWADEAREKAPKVIIEAPQPDQLVPVPFFPVNLMGPDTSFARALQAMDPGPVLDQLQVEFAHLANRIIGAESEPVQSREDLGKVVRKACGYLAIGMECLASEETKSLTPAATAHLLTRYPLADIFRVGFGQALHLKWAAEKWCQDSWFQSAGLSLTFWDEDGLGALGGLFLKRPLYYDNYRSGDSNYREFQSLDEIREINAVLDNIRHVDALFAALDLMPESPPEVLLTYKNLLLTLWAGDYAGAPAPPRRFISGLEMSRFKTFFTDLFENKPDATPDDPRRIPDPMKTAFLAYLARQSGLDTVWLSENLGKTLENLFTELETEFGAVNPEDLDPRFIQLFIITRT